MRKQLICFSLCAVTTLCLAQAQPRPTMPPKSAPFTGDAKAVELLHKLESAFDKQDPIFMELVSTQTLSGVNKPQQTSSQSGRIWMHKPSKIVWQSNGGKLGWNVISDGKNLCMYLPSEKLYTVQPIDKKQLDKQLLPLTQQYGVTLTHLLWSSLRGAQPVVLTRGEDLGMDDIQGGSHRHVRIGTGAAVIDLWLDEKDLPVRIMETQQIAAVNSTVITAIKWITGQPIPDDAFTINPPKDARNVNVLMGLPGVQMPALGAEPTAAPSQSH